MIALLLGRSVLFLEEPEGFAEYFVELVQRSGASVKYGPESAKEAQARVRTLVKKLHLHAHNVETLSTAEQVTYRVDARWAVRP